VPAGCNVVWSRFQRNRATAQRSRGFQIGNLFETRSLVESGVRPCGLCANSLCARAAAGTHRGTGRTRSHGRLPDSMKPREFLPHLESFGTRHAMLYGGTFMNSGATPRQIDCQRGCDLSEATTRGSCELEFFGFCRELKWSWRKRRPLRS